MTKKLETQYNLIAEKFSAIHNIGGNSNNKNRSHFHSFVEQLSLASGSKVLDLACGDGYDASQYAAMRFEAVGIDASKELVRIARDKYPTVRFEVGMMEHLPYAANYFDAVLSKYAIMTSVDLDTIFSEVCRVLKGGGYFAFLVTHPMRQYFEKKNLDADYFHREVVTSRIFNESLSVREPSHTFNNYFTKNFFEKFDVVQYEEAFDPAAERVDGRTYPRYFIVVARKRA